MFALDIFRISIDRYSPSDDQISFIPDTCLRGIKMSPTQKKIFIFANPKAGSMEADQFTDVLAKKFSKSNHSYNLHFIQLEEDIASSIRSAIQDGWNVIAAAGGDGTVSMVVDGLQGVDVPLAILPMGTGNVLAQELGVPEELDGAIDLILGEHRLRPVDGMKMDKHLYLLYIGVGLSSEMMSGASQQSKRRFGELAYLWAGLKKLSGWQPVNFTLEIDSRNLASSAIEIGVTNSRVAGGKPFNWGKDVAVDDRKVLVCIVRGKSLLDYLQTFFDLLQGRTDQSRHIHCFDAREWIRIGAAAPLTVEADGEVVGETPVEIEIIPHAVSIIVPDDSA